MAELLLVLGMHRSGTSAFARAMRVFGGELGSHLLPPAADNPKGFYEDEELQKINDDFLLTQRAHWDSLHLPDLRTLPAATIKDYQAHVWSVLQPKLPAEGFFVFKDPRMCRLWPLWVDFLEKQAVRVKILWVLRNPLAVAESLFQRDSMPILLGSLLWNLHNRSLLGALRQWPHYSVATYESLLNHPGEVLTRIGHDLNMQAVSLSAMAEFVDVFLDRKLNHASSEDATLMPVNQEIITKCKQQYLLAQDTNISLDEKQLIFSDIGENGRQWLESMDFFARQRDELQLHTFNLDLERQRTEEFVDSLKTTLALKEKENNGLQGELNELEKERQSREEFVASLKVTLALKEDELEGLQKLVNALRTNLSFKEQESHNYRNRALYLESLILGGRIPQGTRRNISWN